MASKVKKIEKKLFVYSFYRFVEIKNKTKFKKHLDDFFKSKLIRGTLLIAKEGINGSISGTREDCDLTIRIIKRFLGLKKLNLKINENTFLPFNKMKVRLKNEIVSIGKKNLLINNKNNYISPSDWDNFINRKDVKTIDTRNIYEISIGTFENSINPYTNSFREFPNKINKVGISKEDNIALFCTGGIRCEKASAHMMKLGFKNIFQLEGGILNYLSYKNKNGFKSTWKGECFVFDNRVSINKKMKKGKYSQCHGCRNPITNSDKKSLKYVKGVSCPRCYDLRSETQKQNSLNRQKQIDFAEINNLDHSFRKITQKSYKNRNSI